MGGCRVSPSTPVLHSMTLARGRRTNSEPALYRMYNTEDAKNRTCKTTTAAHHTSLTLPPEMVMMSGSSLRTLRLLLLRLLSALLGALLGGFLSNFLLSHDDVSWSCDADAFAVVGSSPDGSDHRTFACSDSAPYMVRHQFAIFFLLAAIREPHACTAALRQCTQRFFPAHPAS